MLYRRFISAVLLRTRRWAYGIRAASLVGGLDGSGDMFMVNVHRGYGACSCERAAGG